VDFRIVSQVFAFRNLQAAVLQRFEQVFACGLVAMKTDPQW